MKKNFVIVTLSLVIVGLCGYLAYDKLNKTEIKENKEENNKQKEDNPSKEEGKEENNYKEYEILDNIELKNGSKWTVIQKSDKKSDYVIAIAKEEYDDIQEEFWEKMGNELYNLNKVSYDESETKKYVDYIGEILEKKVKLKKVDGYKIRLLKLEDLFAIDDKFKYDSEVDSYDYYGKMDLSSFLGLTMDNTKCSEGKCTTFYNVGSTQCYEEQKDCKEEYSISHWMLGVGGIRPVINVYKSEIVH